MKTSLLLSCLVAVAALSGCDSRSGPVAQRINCVNNLKQIGISFRTWALDNADQYPCNVSTNTGGSMELCAVSSNGFDANPASTFQVMSNELTTPVLLLCPKDRSKKRASDFATLRNSNITYRLRSGTNISEANPKEVLAVCPIDGNTLSCDGTVVKGRNADKNPDGLINIP